MQANSEQSAARQFTSNELHHVGEQKAQAIQIDIANAGATNIQEWKQVTKVTGNQTVLDHTTVVIDGNDSSATFGISGTTAGNFNWPKKTVHQLDHKITSTVGKEQAAPPVLTPSDTLNTNVDQATSKVVHSTTKVFGQMLDSRGNFGQQSKALANEQDLEDIGKKGQQVDHEATTTNGQAPSSEQQQQQQSIKIANPKSISMKQNSLFLRGKNLLHNSMHRQILHQLYHFIFLLCNQKIHLCLSIEELLIVSMLWNWNMQCLLLF